MARRDDRWADYDALTLADAVWGGGGFGTRPNLNLREDKGYSGSFGPRAQLAMTKTSPAPPFSPPTVSASDRPVCLSTPVARAMSRR
jgi:hypothetical protein